MRPHANAIPYEPAEWRAGQPANAETGLLDVDLPRTTDDLIAEMLRRCLHLFDVHHARFVRPLDADAWLVHTRRGDTMLTHVADHAEIAMAWMVGLGRQPLLVNRPRVSATDGTHLRPISARRYLGIPVVCQDRLVGVLEWSGDLSPSIEGTLFASLAWLKDIAERLVFDPALDVRGSLTAETMCLPGQRILHGRSVDVQPDEWLLLLTLESGCTLAELSERLDTPLDALTPRAEALAQRGLLELVDPRDAAPTTADRSHA